MIIELILLFEFIAFIFLGLGLFPHPKTTDDKGNESNTPFMNKVVYIVVAAIIFFSMSATTIRYDYTYCYVNETTANYHLNTSTSTATCADYEMQSLDLSYLNAFMGVVCLVLGIILILFASLSKRIVGDY